MNNNINIIANNLILNKLKTIPYYKTDLGEKFHNNFKGATGVKYYNEIVRIYSTETNRIIFKSGKIGPIGIYTDYGLRQDSLIIYLDHEKFEFVFNINILNKMSMQAYIGNLLKKISKDTDKELHDIDANEKDKKDKEEIKKEGNSEKLFINPGNVSWEDLQKYKKNKK